ncbi:hypothetical protein [Streptomyces sp. NPDC006552]
MTLNPRQEIGWAVGLRLPAPEGTDPCPYCGPDTVLGVLDGPAAACPPSE